ncbi:MAG: hypothetical protein KA143_00675 [Saprospiraceae bacterium]|nr:hypothetical protein [Saprospiraceae bacterium]
MKIKHLASNENMLRYALIATLLVFGFLYNKAHRVKMRSLTGQLNVHVKHLESGNDFITGEEMRTRITNKFQSEFANKPIGSLSPIEIESGLKSMDFVKSADVYVDANSRLNVLVTQREPILRIINHEGYSLYVDKDGTTMPASLHYSPRVLVAYADVPNTIDTLSLNRPGVQSDLFKLTHIIREDRFLNTLIEQMATDNDGDWILVPKLGPSKIRIGGLDNMDEKVESIKKVYKKILPAEGWDKYSVINLKFKGQVICTKKT